MLPSAHHLGGQGKELFLLRVHSDDLAILGGRSCSKIMKLLLKVEAAGIEPAPRPIQDLVWSGRHVAKASESQAILPADAVIDGRRHGMTWRSM